MKCFISENCVYIVGVRLVGDSMTDADEASALVHKQAVADIYSNSWGPNDGFGYFGPKTSTVNALEDGIDNVRYHLVTHSITELISFHQYNFTIMIHFNCSNAQYNCILSGHFWEYVVFERSILFWNSTEMDSIYNIFIFTTDMTKNNC